MADPSRKPADTAFKQQRLPACRPIFTPLAVALTFLFVGVPFVIIGRMVLSASGAITEVDVEYDGGAHNHACQIFSSGAGTQCSVSMTAPKAMQAPVYVYYQISNFYQNHRRYVKSFDKSQMLGSEVAGSLLEKSCEPLVYNGTQLLNPCGLIANSLFNDRILVSSGQDTQYDGTAWAADASKYHQPSGFYANKDQTCCSAGSGSYCMCSGGEGTYKCPSDDKLANYYGCNAGSDYKFYYPKDESTQYLYETFPEVVTPMAGVETHRFQVWMRTAALPKFRKLYAIINQDLAEGETVTFQVEANFDVSQFKGSKALVMTTMTWFGGQNTFLGSCFVTVGSICLAFGVGFLIKQFASPRVLGDLKYLQ